MSNEQKDSEIVNNEPSKTDSTESEKPQQINHDNPAEETAEAENINQEANLQAQQKTNKIRKATNIILAVVFSVFVFQLVADRFIPLSDLGRVRGYVVPVTPEVSGEVVEISVIPNQLVQENDVLARINPKDYEIALSKAEQTVTRAGQNMGALTASVSAAEAKVKSAEANYENAKVQSERVFEMVKTGVMSQAEGDNARAELTSAEAGVASAQADLAKAVERLGAEGENNTNVKSALLELEQAQINLERTYIRAPSQGVASNFRLKEGAYAAAGQPIMTFISADDIWIEASFRENSLGNINPGDKVEFALDYAPGKVFQGEVAYIDYGVDWGQNEQTGKLAKPSEQTGWLRQSQRFPVTIKFDPEVAKGLKRVGGQADVIVYTDENGLLNVLGKLWIRIVSLFSYVR
ncbi:HlyD family secretion protein [Shewanella maritima]|uniref:HlyD family secretion protein n=1 Tax=Shewanella maritima TaxID=2520507 RepID=UPI0037355E8D